jgi:hypothetical protein
VDPGGQGGEPAVSNFGRGAPVITMMIVGED